MDEEKIFILIEEYLDGNLGEEERLAFEQRLKGDAELSAEVAMHREVNERLMALPEKKALQDNWKKIIEQAEKEKNTGKIVPINSSKKHGFGFYLVRVAAVLVLGVAFYFLFPRQKTAGQLAMNYWEKTEQFHYTGGEKSTGPTAVFLEQLKNAYGAYGQNDYVKTIIILNGLNPISDEVLLLKGAAHFQLGDSEKALQNFQKILAQPNASGKDEAQWYLALVFLQKKEVGPAQRILMEILKNKSWQHREAEKLLENLSGLDK